MVEMNKKIVEALSGTLNEKPRISGMAGNLTDKLSLSKASFRKPEISEIEKNREYRNVKAGPAFREPRIAGMEKNSELKRELSFEAPELKEARIAGISGNLYGKEESISREHALSEIKRRSLPSEEKMRSVNAPSIKMNLQNLVTKLKTEKHNKNPENGKRKNLKKEKGSSKGR